MVRRPIRIALLVALLAMNVPSTFAADPGDGFTRQNKPTPVLAGGRTYQITGALNGAGECAFPTSEVRLPDGVTAWVRLTVGLDLTLCRKLVMEGAPTDDSFLKAVSGPTDVPVAPSSPAATNHRAVHRAWWEDIAGWTLTSNETWISWTVSGSYVIGGSVSQYWTDAQIAFPPSHWSFVSGNKTSSLGDFYYFGDSWSTHVNSDFCGYNVYQYYYHVKIYGRAAGNVDGSLSTDTVSECFMLWAHEYYQVYY